MAAGWRIVCSRTTIVITGSDRSSPFYAVFFLRTGKHLELVERHLERVEKRLERLTEAHASGKRKIYADEILPDRTRAVR